MYLSNNVNKLGWKVLPALKIVWACFFFFPSHEMWANFGGESQELTRTTFYARRSNAFSSWLDRTKRTQQSDVNMTIAKWYHTRLWTLPCPEPWFQALVTTNSFSDPSTTSTHSSWFCVVYLIWYYYLSVKFLMWIVKQKIEEKTMTMLTPCMGSMSIRGPPAGVNVINKYKCSAIKLYWNKERLLDDASNVTSSSQSEWFISAQSSNVMLKPLYDIEFRRTREGKESHDPYSVTCSFRHSILYTSFCRCFYDHSAGWSQCDQIGQFIGL